MTDDTTITCGECGAFVAATEDPAGAWKAALANHRRFCPGATRKPPTPPTQPRQEKPMDKMPPPEALINHDSRAVARAAERVLVAQEALRQAWQEAATSEGIGA